MELSIPVPVLDLMERLEDRGFEAWAVGGCVRDWLLGLAPHDWDLCTDALPGEIAQVFEDFPLVRAGEKHGTIAVVTGRQPVEITTFRTEGGYRDHRRPDWVHFEKSLREDLARRDFTINAMAYNPHRGLADPFGGQADLADCILRAVGEPEKRFQEDGLRILRGVRFAARFHLTPEPRTLAAMTALAPTLNGLARERIFGELCGFLPAACVKDFQTFWPVITAAVPALAPMLGFRQHNPHHAFDVYTHTAYVVAGVPPELPLRWAALLHDVAKPACFTLDEEGVGHFRGHAHRGAEMAREILGQLHAPRALQDRVATLIAYHGVTRDLGRLPGDRPLRRLLRRLGEETLWDLLALDRADDSGKGTPSDPAAFDRFEASLRQILAGAALPHHPGSGHFRQGSAGAGVAPGAGIGAHPPDPPGGSGRRPFAQHPRGPPPPGRGAAPTAQCKPTEKLNSAMARQHPWLPPGKDKALPLSCKRENAIRRVRNMRHCTPM